MKVYIIANNDNKFKIIKYIENNAMLYAFSKKNIQTVNDPDDCDSLVFDEENIANARDIITQKGVCDKSYIWIYGTAIPLHDIELLDTIQKRFFDKEDWDNVKHINRIKIEIGYILKNKQLNSYPSLLQMESTSFCNARCIMCSHYYSDNAGALDMTDEMLERLEHILPYIEIAILHGNGEPFLSKKIEESVKLYKKYNVKLTTNTNLSVFNDKIVKMINDSFVDVRVSCDGCSKDIYEGIRRGLSFDRLLSNLEKLRDECPGVSKTMACVMMRQNLEQLPDLVRFAKKYGFREIIFSNLGTSLLVGNEMDASYHYPALAAKKLREAIAIGDEIDIRVTIPNSYDLSIYDEETVEEELKKIHEEPFFKGEEEIGRIKRFTESVVGDEYRIIEDLADCFWEDDLYDCNGICEWCTEKLFMDLKGNVYVCCINATYRIGNIFDTQDFMDIWNNETYMKIRSLFYEGKFPGFCDNCQFVLNGSLSRINNKGLAAGFKNRRHISKFYRDYTEGESNG